MQGTQQHGTAPAIQHAVMGAEDHLVVIGGQFEAGKAQQGRLLERDRAGQILLAIGLEHRRADLQRLFFRVGMAEQVGGAHVQTGGTGDVLAGMVAAHWASMQNNVNSNAHRAACAGAYAHGAIADGWPAQRPLTAQALARTLARAC